MARKRRNDDGDQMDLIPDLHPENEAKLIKIGREYRKAVRIRSEALVEEKSLKAKLIDAINASGITPDRDGTRKFRCGEMFITEKPGRQQLKVKFKKVKEATETKGAGDKKSSEEPSEEQPKRRGRRAGGVPFAVTTA